MTGLGELHRAWAEGRALGAFSVYNLELVRAVVSAAENAKQPVIVQAGSSAFGHAGERTLAALALAAAGDATVEVGVHLDHARDIDEIRRCITAGYSSVMVDGSHLPFTDNVAMTRRVVELAHAADVWVEGELVPIAGEEDRSTNATSGPRTDPALAARFVALTGVDALAVAVGNVHGRTETPCHLDFDALAAIRERVDVPLVLHGASGLDDAPVRRALAMGVAKVNVNTEIRAAFLDGLRATLRETGGDDLASLLAPGQALAQQAVADKIALLGAGVVRIGSA